MSNKKLRIHNTDTDNLISNLRGEVGEIVTSWVLMRNLMLQASGLRTNDFDKDIENQQLLFLDILVDKLSDEIIARLSELAEMKVGRLTFYFVQEKLNNFHEEVQDFASFVKKNGFDKKRNHDISHKELPEKWSDHKMLHIPYPVIVTGIVKALHLMKIIDSVHLGPRSKYLWREMRNRRYKLLSPAKVAYMLLPHIWLSGDDRIKIIREEIKAGYDVWVDMQIKINGVDRIVKTYGQMGAISINGKVLVLPDPFVELSSIDFPSTELIKNDNFDKNDAQP